MAGVFNFLRNYEFLNLAQSVTEAEVALYKKPNQTWAQIGSKFYDICWYNGETILAVGADVVTYLAISALRRCGLFLPPPPAPPTFPIPHDNVEFVQYAVERALWNWDPAIKKELEEGIADSLSEKWNVFQIVGEWSLAFSFENAAKNSYYKPTFLTISEPLEDGESFRSAGIAFNKLRQKERTAILNALYRQEPPPSLSASGKQVYQNIRALASKLHQGNQIYLTAFSDYVKQKESGTPNEAPTQPSIEPSAPPMPIGIQAVDEMQMMSDVHFLRSAFLNAIAPLDSNRKKRIERLVIDDRIVPLGRGYSLETLIARQPETSPKYFVARLAMLRFFKEGYQKNRFSICPNCFSLNERLRNGRTLREAGCGFAILSDRDFTLLQEAIVDPRSSRLDGVLKARLLELSEFADQLHRNEGFLKIYEALRIDLLAD